MKLTGIGIHYIIYRQIMKYRIFSQKIQMFRILFTNN